MSSCIILRERITETVREIEIRDAEPEPERGDVIEMLPALPDKLPARRALESARRLLTGRAA